MIGRPFRLYSLSLVERLGFKTLNNLYSEMNSDDILEWMAYDLIKNPEVRERLESEISMEMQKTFTKEQEAEAIRSLLMTLGHPG